MNENDKSGDSIEGKNARAVVFAVTICALMLFSSFGVMASAMGAEAEEALVADGSAPVEDSLNQLLAAGSDLSAILQSDAGQTNELSSTESPVSETPAQDIITEDELNEMLAQLEAAGPSTKGIDPTPTVTITIQDTKWWGAGKDAPIYMIDPFLTNGYYPLITGSDPGIPFEVRSLVEFDLSSYIGMGYENLITSAEFGMYWMGGPAMPVNPTAYAVTSPWLEGTGNWVINNPGANGVTWFEEWFGMPWFTPGGDYNVMTASPMAMIIPTWYTADVRDTVASWLDGISMPNFGLIVTDPTCPGVAVFESSELWLTNNPSNAPKLTMTFLAVESHAGPLPSQIDSVTANNEFNVPYSATTIESNGLDHVNFYYRYSPDNGTTVPWTAWQLYTVIPGGGSQHIEGDVLFNASAGKGEYQFYTEAITTDGTIEQDPFMRDAETFFHLNGPFPPTNIRAFNNGLNPNVAVYWNLSISDPFNLWYFVAWADNPKWIDFGSMNVTVGLSNATTSALFLNAANDLIPDYYCVRAYDNSGIGWWSNNTDTTVNRDVYYLNPRPPYSGINFDFRNMTVAGNTLTVSNSNLGFDWIRVLGPGILVVNSCDLVIDGDLIILGNVTLNNVNLIMNGTYDGESRIYVAPGGKLTINGGTVQNGVADANYLFEVAGTLTMNNANLTRCGSRNQTLLSEAGLYVSGSAVLNSVWIHDCYAGIIANETATTVQVTSCTIEDCGSGAIAYGSSVLELTDNVIAYCGGVSIQDGDTPTSIFYDDAESGMGSWIRNSQSTAVYFFDGESGEDGWTHGSLSSTDLWHLSTSNYYSFNHAWRDADDMTNTYNTGARVTNWLMSPVIDLSTTTSASLTYYEWLETEDYGSPYDTCYVYVSADAGFNWDLLDLYSYSERYWHQQSYDIAAYATNQFMVQFLFDTYDDWFNDYRGWYIDDIAIWDIGGLLWEQTNSASNSPTNSFTDSASGDYIDYQDLWLQNSVDLTGADFASISFAAMFSIGLGDRFTVEVSTDNMTWTTLDTFTSASSQNGSGTFANYSYSLDSWVGNPTVYFRFRMTSNGSLVSDGVYVDDIEVIAEYPRAYIGGVAVGGYSNYAATSDSTVALTNNIIVESNNYALYTDANSYMDWYIDDVGVCANSGPAANVDINGNIKVDGAGSELYLDNVVGTVNAVDIGAGTTAYVDWSFLETDNVTVTGTLWVNNTVWLISCAYPLQNHIQVIGNMYALYDLFSSSTPTPFAFWAESTANFSLEESTLDNCGDMSGTRMEDFGLCLNTDNAIVIDSDISDCVAGVIANNSSPLIEGNLIEDCFVGVACTGNASTPTIQSNTIIGNMMGIICQGGASPGIYLNTIDGNAAFGISFMATGGWYTNVSADIVENEIDGNGNGGIMIQVDGNLTGSITLNDVSSNNGPGIIIINGSLSCWVDLNISDNFVGMNDAPGVMIMDATTANLTFNDNMVVMNNGDGLLISVLSDIDLAASGDEMGGNDGNGMNLQSSMGGNITASIGYSEMSGNNGDGLVMTTAGDVVLEVDYCSLESNIINGISVLNGGATYLTVIGNYMDMNSGSGLTVDSGTIVAPVISDNEVYQSGNSGISLTAEYDISNALVVNNTVQFATQCIYLTTNLGNITANITGNYANDAPIGIMLSAGNNATLTIQANDVQDNMLVGLDVNAMNTLDANVSGNIAYDSVFGIIVGDPFLSMAPPLYTTVTVYNNSVNGECMIGLTIFGLVNTTANVENNYIDGCYDGIWVLSDGPMQLYSENNTVVYSQGGPQEVAYYVSAAGDITMISNNDTVAANDYDGMLVQSFSNINATFFGGNFNSNADTGLLLQASFDILLTANGTAFNDNSDGFVAQCGGVATITLNNTQTSYNDGNGISSQALSIFATIENSFADYNNLYGVTLNAIDRVWIDMDNLEAYDNSGTNILLQGIYVMGNITDTSGSESDNECGLKINAMNDVILNITDSTFSWNYVNGIEINANTITLNASYVSTDYNDWYDWWELGSGIYLNAMLVDADLSSIWASDNSADGIRVTALDAYVDINDLSEFSNGHNGIYVNAVGIADLFVGPSTDIYYSGWDGIHAESGGPLSVELSGVYLYDNYDNGLDAITTGSSVVDILVHDWSSINFNGLNGIRASSLYWVDITVDDGTWIENNGWDSYSEAGIYITTDGANIDISGNSCLWSNYGNGIEVHGGWTTDVNGVNIGVTLDNGNAYYNWENGISIDTGGSALINITGWNGYIEGNGQCGIDVDTDSSIIATIDYSSVIGNGMDGINLSAPNYVSLDLDGATINNNGMNGAHIDSGDDAAFTAYESQLSNNVQDGLDIDVTNFANIYTSSQPWSSTDFNWNGLNGVHADADVIWVYTNGGYTYASSNGECGLNLSATSYIDMDLYFLDATSNINDGVSAVATDLYFLGSLNYYMDNGANGVDMNASNYLYFTDQWSNFVGNIEDGANLFGGNDIDVDIGPNPCSFSYNGNDGIDVGSNNDCDVYFAPQCSFDNNLGCGANITVPDYIDLYVDGYSWAQSSFSGNGEHGLYANSDSMDATIAYAYFENNLGRGLWLSTTQDLSPTLTEISAYSNGDDGALIQSIDGSVYQTVFNCMFTNNGGNGLAILALNGDIEAYVDNCYLDSNSENGLYLLAQNVSLYPGLSVANSYSGNGADGIHVEAYVYAYMEANLLDSSYNLGNGITLIAPDGQIWLVQVSCDNNYNGIYIDGAIQGEIDSSSTDYNARAGISVNGGYNLWIHDSYASYNTVVGMETYDCSNIDIENNYLEYNGVGIYLNNTVDSTIVNNDVHYNFLDGIDVVNGSDVTLINNMITFNFGWGIFSEPGVNIEWIADVLYNGEYAYAMMNDILLWGNVTVMDFSLMTLEDLTMTIGTNQNLQRNIEIYSDGQMNLNDATIQALGSYWYYFDVWGNLDTDFATIQGAWEVRAYPNSNLNILRSNILDAGLYGIRAEAGSFVNVLDSYFSGCGFAGMNITSNSVMVSGTTFETNYRGIWLVDVGPINIEDCYFIDNDRDGILVDNSLVTIPYCSFNGNGRGVRVDNGGMAQIEYCWFSDNAVGVDTLNGGYADVRLSDFSDNDVGFYLDTDSYVWVENCTMSSLVQEFSQRGDSVAQTLNTVFTGPTYVIDTSQLIVLWYLDVEVLDEALDPIPGAAVDVYDDYGFWIGGGFTDSDGMVRWIICVEYVKQGGVVDDSMNPHTIVVDDGIASDSRDVTMDHTQTQTFVLNHPPVYLPGSITPVFFDQGMWINDVFNLNDCFTDKGDLDFTYSGNTMIYVWINWDGWVSFESLDPDWSGSEWITFRATDDEGLWAEVTVQVTVLRINTGPTITSTPVVTATQDVPYYYMVTATDPDIPYGDYLTYSLSISPLGMMIDPMTGLISWTPASNQVGTVWVMVNVTDSSMVSDMQLYAIFVANANDAPTVTWIPVTSATEGSAYTETVTATDLDLPYGDVLTFSLTTSPAGMVIDPVTGTIYWIPAYNQVGNNLVVVKVTDLGGLLDTSVFTIAVTNVNQAPTITSAPVMSATQGVQYFYQVTASDLDLPYGDSLTFNISAWQPGMAIDPTTGLISWIPNATQIGLKWVTVTVTDTAAAFGTQTFAINVANINDAPTITSAAVTASTAGTMYTYDVNAIDPDLVYGDVLTFSLTTATAGMTIDASTGLIQWMPDWHSPSPVTVVVMVSDSGGLSATQLFQITVSGLNHAPSITGVALSPSEAFADTTISASAVGYADAESDAAQYTYQWYINGAAIGGANGPSVSGLFTKGDIVACEMTPYDGKEYGTPMTSVGIVISNSAPTLEGASILPLSPIMSDELSVTPNGFADNDTQDTTAYYLYQWQYYNTTQGTWLDISGANSETLDTGTLKVGDQVRCIVTPFDGTDSGAPVTSNEVHMHETPGTFPAAEVATISGLIFATLFFIVLVLYIVGKIGKKASGKKGKEEPAPPTE